MRNSNMSYLRVEEGKVVDKYSRVEGITLVKVKREFKSDEIYPITMLKKKEIDGVAYYVPNDEVDHKDYSLENIIPININEEHIDTIPILCTCKYFNTDDIFLKGFKDYLNEKKIMYISPDSYEKIKSILLKLNRRASSIAPTTTGRYIAMMQTARGLEDIEISFSSKTVSY